MSAYLQHTEARTLAAALPVALVRAIPAASDAQLDAALEMASLRIDLAMRYQGRKWDDAQENQFPRIARGWLPWPRVIGSQVPPYWIEQATIWDWDATAWAPIVPPRVKIACVIEAASILAGDRSDRLAARHDGVSGQQIGSASESYGGSGPAPVLCRDADVIMRFYRLNSGSLI